jgi:thiamine biosynthesis lipoprotein
MTSRLRYTEGGASWADVRLRSPYPGTRPPLEMPRHLVKSPRSGVNRRDLLRLHRQESRPFGDGGPAQAQGSWSSLVRAHRAAMGSYFEVRLPANAPGGVDLACRALDLIDALEAQLTVYRDDSEVSRLNRSAHAGPVEVEPGLFGLLQTAVALSRETNGAYDVTSGALSEAWGFVKGPRRVPDELTLADARARTGSHHLRFDTERRTVAFDCQGIQINLGSIGKGYAIDRAVELIRAHWWPTPAIVHGGCSSLFALGSPPGRLGGRWEVALRNPSDPATPLGTLRLRNRALGTSGAAFQQFVVDGQVYGHIIDPRSGQPALGPASVTVLAPTSAMADALSTAFYLLGTEAARAYATAHPEVGVVIVEDRPGALSPDLHVFGLGEHDFVPATTLVN